MKTKTIHMKYKYALAVTVSGPERKWASTTLRFLVATPRKMESIKKKLKKMSTSGTTVSVVYDSMIGVMGEDDKAMIAGIVEQLDLNIV